MFAPADHPGAGFRRVATAIGVGLTFAAVTAFGVAPLGDAQEPTSATIVEELALQANIAPVARDFVQSERVRRGETIASLLERLGAADAQFLKFVAHDPVARGLLRLRAGRSVNAQVDEAGRVQWLQYRHAALGRGDSEEPRRLTIRRDAGTLTAIEEIVPLQRQLETASVVISGSLFAATDSAGIPDNIAASIADIFDAELDMRRDLRRGARLSVVYETLREADSLSPAEANRVLAVQLINGSNHHQAVWFERDEDQGDEARGGEYFRFDGSAMKKAFLHNPLEFSRVSSGFSNARVHPLHRDTRAHKGVDFAAPAGTPVRAAGSGVVEFAGKQRGYGNVIVLRHRNEISTLYAHLRGFAGAMVAGDRVEQGQLIGFVGSTGWATGPHLHYEFMVKGENVDPMSVAAADSEPLTRAEHMRFAAATTPIVARFEQADTVRVAAVFE